MSDVHVDSRCLIALYKGCAKLQSIRIPGAPFAGPSGHLQALRELSVRSVATCRQCVIGARQAGGPYLPGGLVCVACMGCLGSFLWDLGRNCVMEAMLSRRSPGASVCVCFWSGLLSLSLAA